MKYLLYLFLFLLFISCKTQNSEFNTYLMNFRKSQLPILVNDFKSLYSFFTQYDSATHKSYRWIPEKFIKKYICTDGYCNPDGRYFEYRYGVRINFSKNYYAVLALMVQDEYDDETDVVEILLITYNENGQIISREILTKNNLREKGRVKITSDTIFVKQIHITEPNIIVNDNYRYDNLNCDIDEKELVINNQGVINLTFSKSKKSVKGYFDKETGDFKLR